MFTFSPDSLQADKHRHSSGFQMEMELCKSLSIQQSTPAGASAGETFWYKKDETDGI